MKKRILCFFLCVMLALPFAAQAKVFTYTIPELIARQLDAQSSLKVTATAEVSGAAPAFADAAIWEAAGKALSALELKATYFKSKSRQTSGDQQIVLTLNKSAQAVSTVTLTGKGENWFMQSDLIPDTLIALTRDMKTAYMNLSQPEEGTWPDILRTFATVYTADEVFAQSLDDALAPHITALNKWLQEYTQVKMTAGENNALQMTQEITVPASALRKQIKKLLNDLYTDDALMALLRTVLPRQDAEAYLENGMLPLFMNAIDAMRLEESICIVRSYGADGTLTREEITLPFAKGMGVEKAAILISDGEKAFDIALEGGVSLHLTVKGVLAAGNGTVSGEITVVTAPEAKPFEAGYTLALTVGEEQYIEENTSRERDQKFEAVLTLQPREEGAFNEQKITATLHLQAGASNTKPAHIDVNAAWEDTVLGSRISFHAHANTSSALHQSEVDGTAATVVDTLPKADRQAYLSDVSAQIIQAITALTARILAD